MSRWSRVRYLRRLRSLLRKRLGRRAAGTAFEMKGICGLPTLIWCALAVAGGAGFGVVAADVWWEWSRA